MKSVDAIGLSHRVLELLRAGPESTLQLDLLRDGSLRISKLDSETPKE